MAEDNKNLIEDNLPQGKDKSKNASELPEKPFEKGNEEWKKRRNYGTPHFGPLFRAALQKMVLTKDGKQVTFEEAIITRALSSAANGDAKMLNIILDRVEGKPKQPIELSPDGAGTVPITEAEQKRIEGIFGFKKQPVNLGKKEGKVIVTPIAVAPMVKPIGDVKPPIAPGKLVIAMPKKEVAQTVGSKPIILKQNGKPQPNNGR